MVEAQSLMIPSLARKPSHHPKTNQSWNHRNIPVREDPLDISIDSLILNKMLLNRRVSTWYRDEVCFDTHDITSPVSIIVILAENLIIPQPVVFFKKIFSKSQSQVDQTILDLFGAEQDNLKSNARNKFVTQFQISPAMRPEGLYRFW